MGEARWRSQLALRKEGPVCLYRGDVYMYTHALLGRGEKRRESYGCRGWEESELEERAWVKLESRPLLQLQTEGGSDEEGEEVLFRTEVRSSERI